MKTKEEYLKAVDDLMGSYDAYYFMNKYGENTHETQFSMLYALFKDDDMSTQALNWIKKAYDCYYKEEAKKDDDNPFNYLREQINKKFLETGR